MPDAGMAAPRGVVRNEGSSHLMWHRCNDSGGKLEPHKLPPSRLSEEMLPTFPGRRGKAE